MLDISTTDWWVIESSFHSSATRSFAPSFGNIDNLLSILTHEGVNDARTVRGCYD